MHADVPLAAPTPSDALSARRPASSASPGIFDVCHAGVALRALVFVHGVLALNAVWQAADVAAWLNRLSMQVAAALPATLVWLLVACLIQARLGRWLRALYWAAALGWGALCAVAATWALRALTARLDPAVQQAVWPDLLAAAGTGAAFAGALVHWLEQRARLRQPVQTSARLAELQARIRPHFLFNALNSAVALVRVDPARAEAVLEDLSDLFRAALAEDDTAVRLGDELALAQRYLAIEQVRFGDRLRVHWQLDPSAADVAMPPLALQPLVENAVRHGIEPSLDGGELTVRTAVERGQAVVEVSNTLPAGAPAVPATAGHGIALRNVRERLYLLHDVHLHFHAGATADGRWVVRISLPLPP